MFGDRSGHVTLSDRNFHVLEKKHKLFRGEVKGIAYLYDTASHSKQFVVTIGDDAPTFGESSNERSPPLYFIKVGWCAIVLV